MVNNSKFENWNFEQCIYMMKNNLTGIRFIVVIGDGGVGKSYTVNAICQLSSGQGTTVNSMNAKDGTITFFGIYLPDLNVVYIDTPGCYYDETDWWKHIQQLTHVHGYLVLANMQQRNTGYKSLGYTYLQLSMNYPTKVKWYCLGNARDIDTLPTDNYSHNKPHADVLRDVNSPYGLQYIRDWVHGLRSVEYVSVLNPLQLIAHVKDLEIKVEKEIASALKVKIELEASITELKVERGLVVLNQTAMVNNMIRSHNVTINKYIERITIFKAALVKLETDEFKVGHKAQNGGLDSNAPSKLHYVLSWCPCMGAYWLNEHIKQCDDAAKYGHSVINLRKALNVIE